MSDDLSIGERIGELAAGQKINLKELSRRADVPYTTLYAMVNRRSNRVQKATLHKIARALGVTVEVLAGTGSSYLNDNDSAVFKARAIHYFEMLGADLDKLQKMGLYTYLPLEDDSYRPTKDDVLHLADDTGLSISFFLGVEDDNSIQERKPRLQIEGFSEIELALCERHIKKFVADDLKQVLCSAEDAEAIATMLLKHIGSENLISLAKTVNYVSPDCRKAAMAVIYAGVDSALKEKGAKKGLDVELSHYSNAREYDIWVTAQESEFSRSEYTLETDLNVEDAIAFIDSYCPEDKKPPQDQNDPEA